MTPSTQLPQFTDEQLGAAFNAQTLRAKYLRTMSGLEPLDVRPSAVNADTAEFHGGPDPDATMAVLGTAGIDMWAANSQRIAAGLSLGFAYADYTPPPRICALVQGVGVKRTPVLFPTDGLFRTAWGIPVADLAAFDALIAQGEVAILAALAAAQA